MTIGVTYFGKFSDSDGSGTLRKWKAVATYVFLKDQSRPLNFSYALTPRISIVRWRGVTYKLRLSAMGVT